MRTTVTLDPEAEALVKKAMKERGLSFKQVVNDAIKNGLVPRRPPTIDLPTHDYGPALVNLDKATQLAGELEDQEILRKMSMGK
jgi:phosphatidylethanolamine-binding protein (PEBP) family uncharacterized protein